VVQMLLDEGAEVNAQGGHYGNVLQAASSGGHEKVVQMLLNKGAEVNAQGGHYGNILQAASSGGQEKMVQMLLDEGAEVNAQGGGYSNALQAASSEGHETVVQILRKRKHSATVEMQIQKRGTQADSEQASVNGDYAKKKARMDMACS
jgi:ankyrin repeat protein